MLHARMICRCCTSRKNPTNESIVFVFGFCHGKSLKYQEAPFLRHHANRGQLANLVFPNMAAIKSFRNAVAALYNELLRIIEILHFSPSGQIDAFHLLLQSTSPNLCFLHSIAFDRGLGQRSILPKSGKHSHLLAALFI
jgi:hypothetical protein